MFAMDTISKCFFIPIIYLPTVRYMYDVRTVPIQQKVKTFFSNIYKITGFSSLIMWGVAVYNIHASLQVVDRCTVHSNHVAIPVTGTVSRDGFFYWSRRDFTKPCLTV